MQNINHILLVIPVLLYKFKIMIMLSYFSPPTDAVLLINENSRLAFGICWQIPQQILFDVSNFTCPARPIKRISNPTGIPSAKNCKRCTPLKEINSYCCFPHIQGNRVSNKYQLGTLFNISTASDMLEVRGDVIIFMDYTFRVGLLRLLWRYVSYCLKM